MEDRSKQRATALKLANDVRIRKAELKRQLKSGQIRLEAALNNPDLQSWAVGDVVGYACIGQPRWLGTTHAEPAPRQALELLTAAEVDSWTPVSDLTRSQRGGILDQAAKIQARRLYHRIERLRRQARGAQAG